MIGSIVTVSIDRPMGSRHPDYPDTTYPVNYGYIKGMLALDGEEQDAYVLGIERPVDEFIGRVIAIIHREDDVEDKWVVAPDGVLFTEDQIRALVHFQEQYFNSTIELCVDA
jgi:inorganic pyrophosphatase